MRACGTGPGARTEVRDAGQLHFVHELAQPLPVVLLREQLDQVVQLRALLPAQRLHAHAVHRLCRCHGVAVTEKRMRRHRELAVSETRNAAQHAGTRAPSDRRRAEFLLLALVYYLKLGFAL